MKKIISLALSVSLLGSLVVTQSANAQDIIRLYTNNKSCQAVKQAVDQADEDDDKIILRFNKPSVPVLLYDIFHSSRFSCAIDEEAVRTKVPCGGSSAFVGYQCKRKPGEDVQEEEAVEAPIVVVAPPSDDGCGGCETEAQ